MKRIYTLVDLIHVATEVGFGEDWEKRTLIEVSDGRTMTIAWSPAGSAADEDEVAAVSAATLLEWAIAYAREHVDEEQAGAKCF